VVGGLGLIYYFVGGPLLASIDTLQISVDQAKSTLSSNLDILAKSVKNKKTYDAMVATGLKHDEQTAGQQLLQALEDWKTASGITQTNQRAMRTTQDAKKQFSIIGFDVEATGQMVNVDRYLWAIETSPLPIQLNECSLGAVKDGTGQVTMRVTVTALCEPPAGSKPAPQPAEPAADSTAGTGTGTTPGSQTGGNP
jgi:hypothetical protein